MLHLCCTPLQVVGVGNPSDTIDQFHHHLYAQLSRFASHVFVDRPKNPAGSTVCQTFAPDLPEQCFSMVAEIHLRLFYRFQSVCLVQFPRPQWNGTGANGHRLIYNPQPRRYTVGSGSCHYRIHCKRRKRIVTRGCSLWALWGDY